MFWSKLAPGYRGYNFSAKFVSYIKQIARKSFFRPSGNQHGKSLRDQIWFDYSEGSA